MIHFSYTFLHYYKKYTSSTYIIYPLFEYILYLRIYVKCIKYMSCVFFLFEIIIEKIKLSCRSRYKQCL